MREAKHKQALASGVADLNLQITAGQQHALLTYIALLDRWNKAFNLTAVRDQAEMIARHLLDSLSVSAHLQMPRSECVSYSMHTP